MSGDLRDYFPHLPAPPREPLRVHRPDLIRVGFWIMWPFASCCPGRRLIDRLAAPSPPPRS